MGAGDGSRAVLVTGGSRGIGRAARDRPRPGAGGHGRRRSGRQRLQPGCLRGEPNNPAYGASKAGLDAFAQMAREVLDGPGGDAVRAQSAFGRVARPEEVASAVLWLASPAARFSTGTIVDVNGASYLRS